MLSPLTPVTPGEPLCCLACLGMVVGRFLGDRLLLMVSLSWVARGAALAIILKYCLSYLDVSRILRISLNYGR